MIEKYLVGSDPEGFLFDHKTGMHVPAIGLIGGEKRQPRPIIGHEGFAVLEDNVMVEYNIPPSEFGEKLEEHTRFMTNIIEDKILGFRYELQYKPSAEFTTEQLNSEKAQEFGCEPDIDVWEEDIRLLDIETTNMRFAGGHIHFGYPNADFDLSQKIVKVFDLFLGIPSVLLDTDEERRKLYGQAGAFRFKDYGVEYRTLSNFWVNKHEKLIVSLINQSIEAINNNIDVSNFNNTVRVAINTSDKDMAQKLIKQYNIKV